MPTRLPRGLQKLLEVTVGMPWPEGDEDGLRAMSAAWARFAEYVSALGATVASEARTFADAMEGDTATRISDTLAGFPAGIDEVRRGAGAFAKMTENAAADIEKTKIMIVVQLVMLAAAIAELLASLFGAIFVPAVVAAARAGIGALLRALLARLAEAGLVHIGRTVVANMAKYAMINTAITEGLDLGVQAGQIFAGRRQGLDTESLKNTAIGGVIGGAAWGLGAGVSKVLSRAFTEGRLIAPGWFKPFAHLGYSAGQMAVISAVTPGINKATHNGGSVFEGLLGNLSKADVHAPRINASSVKPIARIAPVASLSEGRGASAFVARGADHSAMRNIPASAAWGGAPPDEAGSVGDGVIGLGPHGDGRKTRGLRDFLTVSSADGMPSASTGGQVAERARPIARERPITSVSQHAHAPSAAPPERSHTTMGRIPEDLVRPVPDPVQPTQWIYRRAGAPVGELRTERFDPARGVPAGDGMMPGRSTRISAEVRRIQADDGRWIRDLTLALPVRFGAGVAQERLPEFESRWQAALDRQFNTGLLLPRSGDQLHIGLRLTPAKAAQTAVELSMSAEPARSDQWHFRLQDERTDQAALRNDRLALHELSHFAGVPDTYVDHGSLFRDSAAKAGAPGFMTDIVHDAGPGVPRKYLAAIENAVDSGPVVHDHPLPTEPESGGPLATITEETVREAELHTPVPGFAPLLQNLKVRISEEAGARPGEGTHAVELTGPADLVRRYRVSPVDGPLAERLPAGFTLSDTASGSSLHFSSEGRLAAADIKVEGGRGMIRRDFSAPEQPPALLSPEAGPPARFPVEVRPDGSIGLVAVSGDGRALERLVVNPADGRVVETSAFGRHVVFKAGSSRLSAEELRAIDDLASATVREGLAAWDSNRPLPDVTIEGHGNGTFLGQPNEGRAVRNGMNRAKAVERAFVEGLERHWGRVAAERPALPAVPDFRVTTSSRGTEVPAGVGQEDGAAGRRRAVITVASRQALSEGQAERPRMTLRELLAADPLPKRTEESQGQTTQELAGDLVKLPGEPTLAVGQPPDGALPWYVGEEGVDSLGEVAITQVSRWGEDEVRHWAARIAEAVARGGDSPELAAGIRAALGNLLKGHETATPGEHSAPEVARNKELDFWEAALQRGQFTTADGHVVWLRPVLRDVHPLPLAADSPIQRYNVNWGTLTTADGSESVRGPSADAVLQLTATTGAHVISNVTSVPYVGMSSQRTLGTSHRRYVIFDRKIWMLQGRPFRGSLHVRVFVDGEERLHDVITSPRVTADLPKALTNPGALRPAPHATVPWTSAVAGVPLAHEVVNAIDLIPIAAEFQRRLHTSGLSPEGARELTEKTVALLNERSVMNRSRFLLGNEVVTDRVNVSGGFGRSFKGHVAIRAVVEGLEYLGDTPRVAVREDSGGSVKARRERGGKSGLEVGARVAVAPLEFLTLDAAMTRATGHGLTEETSIHTVLQTVDDQSRYRAWLRITVEPRSTTHEIEPVVRIVPAEIGVPAIEAADFERRLLGEDAHLLRSDGSKPYVRAALADLSEPGLGLPESAFRRPARLDAPLPQPHPRESIALASRRGIGFASTNGLPGAELIHDQLRTVLLQKHHEWTGSRRVDLSGVDRVLLSGFGRPVLEGDLAQLLAGLERQVGVEGETYHLSVTATLLERVGGVTGEDARTMSINMRASQITAVDGHRDTSWRVGGFLGARVKVALTPELNLQLGHAGLSGTFGGGTKHEFSGSAKSSQRAEMGGKADEHIYNVIYEMSVRRGDRQVRWWIDKPGEVVARVALSHLHVPREPVAPDVLAAIGRVKLWRRLPEENTVDFRTNGTGAVFRSFLAVSEVPRMAAHLYRQANRLPEEWLAERGNWPGELKNALSPTELATHFTALTSVGGRLLELPDGTDGWRQALRIRVMLKDPRHVRAHTDGTTFQIWQNTSASTKYVRSDKQTGAGGLSVHLGPSVKLGAPTENVADDGQEARQAGDGSGHGLSGHIYAVGGFSLEREYQSEHSAATYPLGITRGTYGGPMHSYRADPVFEITLTRWAKGGSIDRLTGRPREIQDFTRVVEIKDAVEFVLPQRRIFDLRLPVPEGTPVAEPKPPEGHLDIAILPGGTHPEVLHADGVLEVMKKWLTEQGLLRLGRDGTTHVPTPILRELQASFASSALLNQFTLLNTSGVMRWWPLESAFGSTRYLWARVTAETGEPLSQMDRPEMAAMLRGKAFTELSTTTSRSTELEGSVDLRAWLGGSRSGGLEAKAGYAGSSEESRETADKNVDIYWGQTKNPSVELQLRQRFRVQMRITRQQPELLSAPLRGLHKASLAVAGWVGYRREMASGWQNTTLTDKRFEAVTDGDVRVIVPRHLILPGPPPPRRPDGAGLEPNWESAGPPTQSRELVELVTEHGHPWALPAAAAVQRWAAVAGASSLSRPGLARPELWRPEGTTIDGMLYDLFTNEVLLRLNLPSLLRLGYSVPVGAEKVHVGLRITRLTPLPEHDVDILSRHYNQGRETDEHVRGAARGARLGLGLIVGGQPEEGPGITGRLPFEYEFEHVGEQATESQEIMERNVSSTRPFRYYRADVDVVFHSGRHGRLRVHVPDGLYLMLPASLSEDPALRAAHRHEANASKQE